METAFQKKFGEPDYAFEGISEYDIQSPPFGDGSFLTFHRREKIYALNDDLLRREWKPLCRWVWEVFRRMFKDRPERGFHASIFDDDLYRPLLEAFEKIEFAGFDKAYRKQVEAIEDNYFLRFDDIPAQVVYEGWPLPTDHASDMDTVTFLYGYEKMGLIAAETAAFWEFARHVRTEGAKEFRLARYVWAMGF